MEKLDNMQEQKDNIKRDIEILRKNQKEMIEIKNTITEMKNAFAGIRDCTWLRKEYLSLRM